MPNSRAGLEDVLADLVAFRVRSPDLEAGRAGHAVTQAAHLAALDVDRVHREELHVGDRTAVDLVENLPGVRALHLEAIVPARDGLAARMRGRTIVADEIHLEAAGLGMELQPVHRRRTADEHQFVLLEVEQDAVADDVAFVAGGHHLLRAVHREVREAVDCGVGAELERVRPLERELGHVVRLVEQHRGIAPCLLLVAPVGEFARHDGIDVRADLRIAKELNGIAGGLEHAFQVLLTHEMESSMVISVHVRQARPNRLARERNRIGLITNPARVTSGNGRKSRPRAWIRAPESCVPIRGIRHIGCGRFAVRPAMPAGFPGE